MTARLSEIVIQERMVEWRNLKSLHVAQGIRIERLETENKALRTVRLHMKLYYANITDAT
jgi:hypothetical protein